MPKDRKFKKAANNYYQYLRSVCFGWCNKYCNNGHASLKGLRKCYNWRDAYIIFCNNTYIAVPKDVFDNTPSCR